MSELFKFGEMEDDDVAQLAKDQAYIQKLLKKDAELNKIWNDLNEEFDTNHKKKLEGTR